VENSTAGSSVATVPAPAATPVGDPEAELHDPASASTSASVRWVQWSCRELVAVHPGEQAGLQAGPQHGAGLVLVERGGRGGLAEHVDPAGVRRAGGEHRPGHEA
jgi:hypothetical protein